MAENRPWAQPCTKESEFCTQCGQKMGASVEFTRKFNAETGAPVFREWHSCPQFDPKRTGLGRLLGWMGWFGPRDHDSHAQDNPLIKRYWT